MPRIFLPAAVTLALAAGAAVAGPAGTPGVTAVCLDAAGGKSPPVCQTPAGRLQPAESSCICPTGVRVEAPVCPSGVSPPPESAALKAARRTASADGTLAGDVFGGRPMCERARLSR